MPYISPDSASSICLVRNRYRGSGFTLNGFSFSPKKLLYMTFWRLRFYLSAQNKRPRMPAHSDGNLVGRKRLRTAVRTTTTGRIGLLHIGRIAHRKRCVTPQRPGRRNPTEERIVVCRAHSRHGLGIPVVRITRVQFAAPNSRDLPRRRTRYLVRGGPKENSAPRRHPVKVVGRDASLWNQIVKRSPTGARNVLGFCGGRLGEPVVGNLGTRRERQCQSARYLTSEDRLEGVVANGLWIVRVVKGAEAILQTDRVIARDLVVVAKISHILVAWDVSRVTEAQQAVEPSYGH